MRTRFAVLGVACLMLWLAHPGRAYSLYGQRWAGSSITMHLQQGSSSGTLIDGSSDWNAVTEGALSIWNPFLNGTSFRVVRDSTSAIGSANGINNVIWGDDVFGQPFGPDTLAITRYRYFTSDN